MSGDPGSTAPQVEFRFEYEETGDGERILTVSHYGGDTVAADQLFVRGSGFANVDGADQTSAGQWQGSASGDDGGVVWASADGNRAATLAEDRGPDA